ncbi:sporulation protein YhbH [Sphaerobacter sp.]|uniref:sporulation protein YhbH n=1 Tax=Sphaerobacter sp. TaxID=2099654 RepID=UPI001DD41D78|nr:sporulation protein YhbH [Sphaerobacter sp.]MBX5446413.1 sporulation protein YhbH [Sphaerobacter sp.]
MFTVTLTQNDWSLHRKGAIDQARHKQKVKEAIRQNLADIVSEQSIITSDGKKIVRVPIRTLEEYKFRFDPNDQQQVGEGDGNSQVGDVLERIGQGQGPGRGPKAGDQPGIDYYEAELTMDELAEMVFEDLCLPNLEEKRLQELESEVVRFTDIRKSGPYANLDKKRTIRENIKRNAKRGDPRFGGLKNDDLRFKTWERDIRRESNAVVIAMMDVSGSMGTFEKYISRAFYYWMVRFLRTKYDQVAIVFIAHHTEAKEVTEEEFFTRGESGGTKASSAYQLALDLIAQRFNPANWNIYPFHFSDGDNWPSDNELCRQLADQLLAQCNLFGYGEIRQGRYSYQSTLMHTFQQLDSPKFVTVTIGDKTEVYPALRRFFGPEVGAGSARRAAKEV